MMAMVVANGDDGKWQMANGKRQTTNDKNGNDNDKMASLTPT